MTDCMTIDAATGPLDPRQRVHYNFGMVLGVNDFRQEQAHFEWKHALGNEFLHGYGTVCGLALSAAPEPGGADVRISVTPGFAVSPKGRWIRVPSLQCGLLGGWIADQSDSPPLGPGPARAYVTLCADECQTELVPVASEACASEDDSRKPSRTLETFRLEFSSQAPVQAEEQAARRLGALLGRVQVVPDASPPDDDGDRLLALVGELAASGFGPGSPPGSPPLLPPVGSPDEDPLRLPEGIAAGVMRRVLRTWVTEVCPRLREQVEAAPTDCLLLAALDFDLDAQGALLPASVRLDETERPILIAGRLQQELFGLVGRLPGL